MIRKLSPRAVDAVFVIVLGAIALAGFHATFEGLDFLIAGCAGLVIGTILAVLAVRLGQPVIVLAVFTVASFFLIGGAAALHGLGGLSWLPLPHTLGTLAHGSVDGWKDLLTTLPPVDGGVLLVIPYLLGLVGGVAATTLALRLTSVVWPALVPVAMMAAVILLGAQRPGQVAINAGVFFVALLAWSVVRARRAQLTISGRARLRQIVVATSLAAGASVVGTLAGPQLPGVADSRYVLRSQVVPPFDIGDYPSPLASYRRYTPLFTRDHPDVGLAGQPLFKVTGLPANTFVRVATLDDYTGTVWAASNGGGGVNGVADTFQRVGTTIGSTATGQTSGPVTVTIDRAYVNPPDSPAASTRFWIPIAGSLTRIAFSAPAKESVADQLRYNLATDTAILPGSLSAGDTYTFTAVNTAPVVLTAANAGKYRTWQGSGAVPCPIDQCQTLATTFSGGHASILQQIMSVAQAFKDNGYLSDGEKGSEIYWAGHSLYRLNQFALYKQHLMVGDGEQYAALMALVANQLGVPARVVVGAVLSDPSGTVHGKDIQAWVEIRLADGSWAYLPQDAFTATKKNVPPLNTHEQKPESAKQVPAPLPLRPPASASSPLDDGASVYNHARKGSWWSGLLGALWWTVEHIGFPIAVIVAICWLILFGKRRRAHYRRTRGTPANRLAGAWHEYLDRAFDHGHTVPPRSTRREQAAAIPLAAGVGLARSADNHIFGRGVPTPDAAEKYWTDMEDAVKDLTAGLPRWKRWLIALNPISLIPRPLREKAPSVPIRTSARRTNEGPDA